MSSPAPLLHANAAESYSSPVPTVAGDEVKASTLGLVPQRAAGSNTVNPSATESTSTSTSNAMKETDGETKTKRKRKPKKKNNKNNKVDIAPVTVPAGKDDALLVVHKPQQASGTLPKLPHSEQEAPVASNGDVDAHSLPIGKAAVSLPETMSTVAATAVSASADASNNNKSNVNVNGNVIRKTGKTGANRKKKEQKQLSAKEHAPIAATEAEKQDTDDVVVTQTETKKVEPPKLANSEQGSPVYISNGGEAHLLDPATLEGATVIGSSPENPSVAASNGDRKSGAKKNKRNRKSKAASIPVAVPVKKDDTDAIAATEAEKDDSIAATETEKVETPALANSEPESPAQVSNVDVALISDLASLELSSMEGAAVSGSSSENPPVAASNGDQNTGANKNKRNRKSKAGNNLVAVPVKKDDAITATETEKVEAPDLANSEQESPAQVSNCGKAPLLDRPSLGIIFEEAAVSLFSSENPSLAASNGDQKTGANKKKKNKKPKAANTPVAVPVEKDDAIAATETEKAETPDLANSGQESPAQVSNSDEALISDLASLELSSMEGAAASSTSSENPSVAASNGNQKTGTNEKKKKRKPKAGDNPVAVTAEKDDTIAVTEAGKDDFVAVTETENVETFEPTNSEQESPAAVSNVDAAVLSDPATLELSMEGAAVSGSSSDNPSVAASNSNQKTGANKKKTNRKPNAANPPVAVPGGKDDVITVTEKAVTPELANSKQESPTTVSNGDEAPLSPKTTISSPAPPHVIVPTGRFQVLDPAGTSTSSSLSTKAKQMKRSPAQQRSGPLFAANIMTVPLANRQEAWQSDPATIGLDLLEAAAQEEEKPSAVSSSVFATTTAPKSKEPSTMAPTSDSASDAVAESISSVTPVAVSEGDATSVTKKVEIPNLANAKQESLAAVSIVATPLSSKTTATATISTPMPTPTPAIVPTGRFQVLEPAGSSMTSSSSTKAKQHLPAQQHSGALFAADIMTVALANRQEAWQSDPATVGLVLLGAAARRDEKPSAASSSVLATPTEPKSKEPSTAPTSDSASYAVAESSSPLTPSFAASNGHQNAGDSKKKRNQKPNAANSPVAVSAGTNDAIAMTKNVEISKLANSEQESPATYIGDMDESSLPATYIGDMDESSLPETTVTTTASPAPQHAIVATCRFQVLDPAGSSMSSSLSTQTNPTTTCLPAQQRSGPLFAADIMTVALANHQEVWESDPATIELVLFGAAAQERETEEDLSTVASSFPTTTAPRSKESFTTVPMNGSSSDAVADSSTEAPPTFPTVASKTKASNEPQPKKGKKAATHTPARVVPIQGPSSNLGTTPTKYFRIFSDVNAVVEPLLPSMTDTAISRSEDQATARSVADPCTVPPEHVAAELEYGLVASVHTVFMANNSSYVAKNAAVDDNDYVSVKEAPIAINNNNEAMSVPAETKPDDVVAVAPLTTELNEAMSAPAETKPDVVVAVAPVTTELNEAMPASVITESNKTESEVPMTSVALDADERTESLAVPAAAVAVEKPATVQKNEKVANEAASTNDKTEQKDAPVDKTIERMSMAVKEENPKTNKSKTEEKEVASATNSKQEQGDKENEPQSSPTTDTTKDSDRLNHPIPVANPEKPELRRLSDVKTSNVDPAKDTSKAAESALSQNTPFDDKMEKPVLINSRAATVGSTPETEAVTERLVTTTDAATDAKPKLLVLCSHQSLDRAVATKQRNAFMFLDAKSIHYDTLDGAEPKNKETRNNLFTVSGIHAQYPQFFVVQGDQLNFWGDWERFEASNEMGTLAEDLFGENASCGATKSHNSEDKPIGSIPGTSTATEENGSKQREGGSGDKVLVLYSNLSLNREVTINQEKAFIILKSEGIAYDTLDGAAPLNKEKRNELFETSGIRAKYPQFFLTDVSGQTTFWGDWQRFETANETGSLSKELVGSELAAGNEEATEASRGTTKGSPLDPQTGAKGRGLESSDKSTPSSDTKEDKAAVASDTSRSVDIKVDSRPIETDITIYGATGFVAKHILAYLTQKSVRLDQELKITLAGRNPSKLQDIHSDITEKMKNLRIITPDSTGYCTFDTFVAESLDTESMQKMADRTRVVLNCAGPFAKYGSNVVWACALTGADYVDITGEVSWAGKMRAQNGSNAAASGSRIISFCGFDSIPSDLAVYTAIEALKEKSKVKPVTIERATTWHDILGGANGGTIKTMVETPFDASHCLFQPVPFLVDDPLVLTHPSFQADPASQATRNRLAASEWWNQLLSFDTIIRLGVTVPFFMAVVNAKIVHASAVALNYGPNFTYRERHVPTGFRFTAQLGLISLLPALLTQLGMLVVFLVLKFPVIGQAIIDWLLPPGTGSSDQMCRAGFAEVYAEVIGPVDATTGRVDKANCFIAFEGDPGNWVTAQCISESALALVLNRDELPPRSQDGFGTPVELLGKVLLKRLKETKVRPIVVQTSVRLKTVRHEWSMFP